MSRHLRQIVVDSVYAPDWLSTFYPRSRRNVRKLMRTEVRDMNWLQRGMKNELMLAREFYRELTET